MIKRTAIQLLSEFIERQKIRLVGVGVSRLRERDMRQTLITDFKKSSKGVFERAESIMVKRLIPVTS